MFDSLRERAAVLDEEICKVEDIAIERMQINDLMDIRMTQVSTDKILYKSIALNNWISVRFFLFKLI